MARNPKSTKQSRTPGLPASTEQLLDELVTGPMTAETVQDTFILLKKALIERALGAELGRHLGYPAGGERPEDVTNQRNGKSSKTVLTDDGPAKTGYSAGSGGQLCPDPDPQARTPFYRF